MTTTFSEFAALRSGGVFCIGYYPQLPRRESVEPDDHLEHRGFVSRAEPGEMILGGGVTTPARRAQLSPHAAP
jgi:hypothetical protein